MKPWLFIALALITAVQSAWSANERITLQSKNLFLSGLNIAWINFAEDVGDSPLDENRMRKILQDIRTAGGNAARWWLFTNGARTPTFSENGYVNGLSPYTITNITKALDIAEEYGIVLSLCLLSFDLLQEGQVGSWNNMSIENNIKMLTTDAGVDSLVQNAVVPLVKGVGNHAAIMSWEVFNEPEGMTSEFGWTKQKVSMSDVQKVTNRVAAAVHDNAPGLLVSTGIHSFHAASDVFNSGSKMDYYRDDRLVAAGGKQNGTLDFYQVHFYPEHFQDDRNPFVHKASYWGINKPIVIGEFPAGDWTASGYKSSKMTNQQAFQAAYDSGYAGAMSWDYNGFVDGVNASYKQNCETTAPSLTALYQAYEADIKIKDFTPVNTTGNGVMQVNFDKIDGESTLETSETFDLSSASSLQVEARVISGSTFSFRAVMKIGSNWDWFQVESSCPVTSDWTICTFDFKDFSNPNDADMALDPSQVKAILFQTFSDGFTGSLQFNNVKAGNVVIDDFDEQFDVWSIASGMSGGAAISSIATVYISDPLPVNPAKRHMQDLQFIQNSQQLFLTGLKAPTHIRIVNPQGEIVFHQQTQNSAHRISLQHLSSGIYWLQAQNSLQSLTQSFVIQ